MIELRQGIQDDSDVLAQLVLSSAPILLPYLFQGKENTLSYIQQASKQVDGQYSAMRHTVALYMHRVVGCITYWDKHLPTSFNTHTLRSLSAFLSPTQISHLVDCNDKIASVFLAPADNQLCIGHLAVLFEHRGLGIGKKLIAQALNVAKLRHKTQLVLDVDSKNEEALSFYLGLGFVLVCENYFAATQQCFYRMQYSL